MSFPPIGPPGANPVGAAGGALAGSYPDPALVLGLVVPDATGAAATDTANLAAAAAAAATAGGAAIYLGMGTYSVDTQIVSPANTAWIGQGTSTVIEPSSSALNNLFYTDANNVAFERISFNGTNQGGGTHLLVWDMTQGLTPTGGAVRNCVFENVVSFAVFVNTTGTLGPMGTLDLEGNTFTQQAGANWDMVTWATTGGSAVRNHFFGAGTAKPFNIYMAVKANATANEIVMTAAGEAVALQSTIGVSFVGNSIDLSAATGGVGIQVNTEQDTSGGAVPTRNIIANNTILGNSTSTAIALGSLSTAENLSINGNIFDTHEFGIDFISGTLSNIIVQNNYFLDVTTATEGTAPATVTIQNNVGLANGSNVAPFLLNPTAQQTVGAETTVFNGAVDFETSGANNAGPYTHNNPTFKWTSIGAVTITGTVTLMITLANAVSGAITLTLPAATIGRVLFIKKTDSSANAVTIAPASGDIDGSASISLTAQNEAVELICDGTNWWVASAAATVIP